MFSSMKKEEYMESELSGIFQVKMVTKNIVLGSLGTQRKVTFAVHLLNSTLVSFMWKECHFA